MADYILTNADFRAKLTANGVDLANDIKYKDTDSCLRLVNDILDALREAQLEQNQTSADGADVDIISNTGRGVAEQREFPPGSGTFLTVLPVSRQVSYTLVSEVTSFVPNLA